METLQNLPQFFQSLFEPWLLFLADDPLLRLMQALMLITGGLVIFLVFYTTRDILLRTNSFALMLFSIFLVAILPVFGFLIYLIIRPATTLQQRRVEAMLNEVTGKNKKATKKKAPAKKKPDTK